MTFFPSIDNYFKSNCVGISFSFLVQKFAYTLDLLVVPLEVTRTIKSKLSSKAIHFITIQTTHTMNRIWNRKAGALTDIFPMAGYSVVGTAFFLVIIFKNYFVTLIHIRPLSLPFLFRTTVKLAGLLRPHLNLGVNAQIWLVHLLYNDLVRSEMCNILLI